MDISFTNVLEGARQYFQGLPAASSSTGSPATAQIQQQPRENDGSVHSEQHSAVPFWGDHQNEGQGTNLPNRDVMNPPQPSRPVQQSNPPPSSSSSTNFHYEKPQPSSYTNYPHIYQPHIPSSRSYHYEMPPQPPKTSYANTTQPHQTESASNNTTYTYQTHTNNHPHQYPSYAQNSTSSTSQAQEMHYNYKQQYTSQQQQASRSQQSSYPTNYYPHHHQQQVQPQPQQRVSHQLPVVPTDTYHSRPNSKPIQHASTTNIKSNYRPPPQTFQRLPLQNGGASTSTSIAAVPSSSSAPYSDQYKYYPNAAKYTTYSNTATTTTYSNQYMNPAQNYIDTRVNNIQQRPQIPKFADAKPPIVVPVQQQQQKVITIAKQKRESPLDLSVKTVKTTADSTHNVDYEERNYRNMQQNRYEMYTTTARAPKVDFLPNFHMPNNPPKDPPNKNNYYNYPLPTSNPPREQLPRIDFPAISKNPVEQRQKRRMDHPLPSAVPEKMPKVDTWRQNIDKQIEQRLSSYTKSRIEPVPKPLNGNIHPPHPTTQLPQNNVNMYNEFQQKFTTNTDVNTYKMHSNNNNNNYQYPQYAQYNPNYNYQIQKIPQPMPKPPNKQTATKNVLNLLRNTIHTKGAKKIEHDKLLRQNYREIQQPSTDVMAPLQPKPSIIGRRNVSPFTAASLERNSNTPPAYKLHIPKAIDSVIFSDSEKDQQDQQASMGGSQSGTDLDGLAAFLAARIRTKAELKQVGPSEQTSNNNFSVITTASPPKLLKESQQHAIPPVVTPKKLFHRDNKRADVSIRSSSETSVFDFPDSDNEAEMPVLERQSLVEMRKDRKTVPNQFTSKDDIENDRPVSPFSMMFNNTCDTFMEQLKHGFGKKRGRRKKMKLDDAEEESSEPQLITDIKKEPEEMLVAPVVEEITIKQEPIEEEVATIAKDKSDSDSDTPLIICKHKILSKVKDETIVEDKAVVISSDSEVDNTKSNNKKPSMLDLKDKIPLAKPAKKPAFGDGSDFHPGWEEELYKYKKSLRMPRMLIQVTRPPNCQRLSTSLPDLDPCPVSPADPKFKRENNDSDVESNCSFNFALTKTLYESEEGGGSIKCLNSKYSSILDRLMERYGAKKRKRLKKIDDTPKIIPKSENPLELLPTPNVEDQKKDSPVKTDLNFRKKTVENFKAAFSKNLKPIVGANEFTTVVLKSRTRTETRVLKEKATIREVFGEDRPASAPPITCLDELKPDDICEKQQGKENKAAKLLNENFLKVLEKVQIKAEADIKKEEEVKTDEGTKKRSKLRSIRRKFSSGFDYIRKKKKIIKKEDAESEVKVKSKKRWSVPKAVPESVEDIQKEIKMWVLNKGVGETHLHRAARSGFIDITAYCLEKMACNPSPKDNAGYTPLHEACSKGHLAIAELLLQYGAQVSESAQGGIRPLHEAAENGFVEIVRLLLAYGADPMLATYSGITPLQLAVDETTVALLQQHLDELQGKCNIPWNFNGPSDSFDTTESGYNPLLEIPEPDSLPVEEEDMEFEDSEFLLPNLYTLPGDADTDRWVLLQDLTTILKIKSKETLLRQLNVASTSNVSKSDIVRELKTADFLEKAKCCQFLNANEKLNTRATKIFLVKYTEKVKELLNVQSEMISAS